MCDDHSFSVSGELSFNLNCFYRGQINKNATLNFIYQHQGFVQIVPQSLDLYQESPMNSTFCILGISPGNIDVTAEITPDILE